MREIRLAFRALGRAPGFATVVVLTLALGIGATTAIFSVVNAVLLKPLPYGNPEQLAYVWAPHKRFAGLPVNILGPSNADAVDLKREASSIDDLAQFRTPAFNLVADSAAMRVSGARVSGNFFSLLRVQPTMGRMIGPLETREGQEAQVVISHRLWRVAFAGDPSVLDRSLRLNGQPYRIVGVMPRLFRYPEGFDLLEGEVETGTTDVWVPLTMTAEEIASRDFSDNTTIVRLRSGVPLQQAQAELARLAARLDSLRPPDERGWSVFLESFQDAAVADVRRGLWLLFAAVSLILLLACSNAAQLLLARNRARATELGIRSAMGASRGRLIRTMLIEASMLVSVAAVVGLMLATAGVRVLLLLNPGIPRMEGAAIDGRVLAFTMAAACLTMALFAVAPAVWASATDVNTLLRQASDRFSRSDRRVGSILIAAEVALAVVLMTGAALFVRSFANVQRINPGFATSSLFVRVSLDERYSDLASRVQFFQDLLARASAAFPGAAIGAIDTLPLSHAERLNILEVEGYPNVPNQLVQLRAATDGYFAAMDIPLLEGRVFRHVDAASAQQVIVNGAFARMYFPNQSAVGRRLRLEQNGPWVTISGVVGDVRHSAIEDPPQPQVYRPFWAGDIDRANLVIQPPAGTGSDTRTAWTTTIRSVLRTIDPSLAVEAVRPMGALVRESRSRREFQTLLVSVFGTTAIVLAAIGLYGLLTQAVRQRTRELGIRIALGATPGNIVGLIVGYGLSVAAAGLVAGMAGAAAATRLVASRLYGVSPADSIAFGSVVLVLIAAAGLSCLVPALRVSRLDAVNVIRGD